MAGLDEHTVKLIAQVAGMTEKVNAIESKVTAIDDDLSSIKTSVEELSTTVKTFKKWGYVLGAAFLGNGGAMTWIINQAAQN